MKTHFCLVSLILLLIMYLISIPAFAGRPLITEDAPTVGKNRTQLEMGYDYTKSTDGETISGITTTITYGFADNFDIAIDRTHSIELPYKGYSQRNMSDLCLSAKYRFIEETKSFPAFGIKISSDTNDGNESDSINETMYGANLFATKNFKNFTLHANLGMTVVHPEKGFTAYDEMNYSIAAEKPISDRITIVGEFAGQSNQKFMDMSQVQIGLTYRTSPSLTFDAGYSRGLNINTPKNQFTAGITIEF